MDLCTCACTGLRVVGWGLPQRCSAPPRARLSKRPDGLRTPNLPTNIIHTNIA